MGLFSSVKKGLSKAWKGVKGAVKKVAKVVKKTAKAVAYSTPLGKELWKAGGKLGKEITKGIGKLGPAGIIAAQVLLSSTGIGAGLAASLSSMWSGFGAAAAAASQAGSVLGSLGTAVYNGVNYAAGTLGAVGEALSSGAKELVSGNFSTAASNFGSNLGRALTGEAGTLAKAQGIASYTPDIVMQSTVPDVGSLLDAASGQVTGPQSMIPGQPYTPSTVTPTAAPSIIDSMGEKAKDYVTGKAKSLISAKPPADMEPAAGYRAPENTVSYELPDQQALAAPTQSQQVVAATLKPVGY